MNLNWRTRDIIDLEFFLNEDDQADDASVWHRDRDIFLKDVLPVFEKEGRSDGFDRKKVIRFWLEGRRRYATVLTGKEKVFPGKIFADIFTILAVFFLLAGALAGSGMAFSLLSYRGIEPVNVSIYFSVFVLFQVILIISFLVSGLFRRWFYSLRHISFFQSIFRWLVAGVFRKVSVQAMDHISAETRNRLSAVAGVIKGQKRAYSPVFYWPVFLLAQLAGMGFNLGVIGGSLLKILGTDLAFGWQSTVQFSSRAVYTFVKTVALPWSSLVPPSISYPTLTQIEGSRMILKDGIHHLTTPDLVAWWPFLLMAVFFYGLLPRIILFITGIVSNKRALKNLDLSHAACNRLMRRMTSPVIKTDGRESDMQEENRPADQGEKDFGRQLKRPVKQAKTVILLVPDDICRDCSEQTLDALITHETGMILKQMIDITMDFEADKKVLAGLAGSAAHDRHPFVVIQEAWQPPIAETLLYFRKLREMLGSDAELLLFLIGKPIPDGSCSRISSRDFKIWKQAIQTLGDPFLEIDGLRDAQ